jgi:hypothetical protein
VLAPRWRANLIGARQRRYLATSAGKEKLRQVISNLHHHLERRVGDCAVDPDRGMLLMACGADQEAMYLTRWRAEVANGSRPLSPLEGFRDTSFRWVVTHDIAEWKDEIAWM